MMPKHVALENRYIWALSLDPSAYCMPCTNNRVGQLEVGHNGDDGGDGDVHSSGTSRSGRVHWQQKLDAAQYLLVLLKTSWDSKRGDTISLSVVTVNLDGVSSYTRPRDSYNTKEY
jgi:hypothetical protein